MNFENYFVYILLAQLKLNEVVTEGFCLRTQPIATPIVQNLLVGEYSLYWKRFVSCIFNIFD